MSYFPQGQPSDGATLFSGCNQVSPEIMYVGAGDHLDMAGNEQECAIVWHLTDRSGRGWTFQKAQINQSPESCWAPGHGLAPNLPPRIEAAEM